MAAKYRGIFIPCTGGDFNLYRVDDDTRGLHVAVVAVDGRDGYSTHMMAAHEMEDMENMDAIVEFAIEWHHDNPTANSFSWEPAPN